MNIAGTKFRRTIAVALLVAPCALAAQGPTSTGTTAPGTVDLFWYAVNAGPPPTTGPAYVLGRGNVLGSYSWIAVSPSGDLPGGAGDGNFTRFGYVFETMFTGGGVTGATYQCTYDDAFQSVMLNGVIVDGPGCDQYNVTNTYTLTGFNAGSNVLRFTSSGNGISDGLMVHFTGVTRDVVSTPEPTSVVLLATGLVGVFGAARRRRRA